MFHLTYPRFRGFFTWDELGCMSRALGFTVDLFKSHLIDEIQAEDNGLPIKEIIKMLDFKLLYKALHLSQNLHTDDWNTCVFRSCISILDRKALTFEDIYQARIAYQTYEASDMKGMLIDQHMLLRSLKMCGKTISPMKLMHRVKHNSVLYDEPGRIQLYEFLDLLLWANGYVPYVPEKSFGHFEMEDSLFKLHDFNTLLTHHDEKLASKLDNQYLQEEWAFVKTKYASKSKLTDPAVISANRRIETVSSQKNEFRKLKHEVGNSQTLLYKAAQGYIRQRPVTAPNLSMYDTRRIEAAHRRESMAAQHKLNEKVQRLIKRTEHKDANNNKVQFDLSDKPAVNDYRRCQTPLVVSANEKDETDKRMECLMFDIETEEGRYEIAMDTEMDHYIPGFKETYLKNKTKGPSAPHIPNKVKVKVPPPERYDMSKMSHPIPKISPCHAQRCDARFRGWYGVRSKKGPHYILMSPYVHNSTKGQLLKKIVKMSDSSAKKLHGDFIYRYTKDSQVDQRPVTAPAVMTAEEYESKRGRTPKISRKSSVTSGYISMDSYDDNFCMEESYNPEDGSVGHHADVLDLTQGEAPNLLGYGSNANCSVHSDISKSEHDLDTSRDTVETSLSDKVKLMKLTDPERDNVNKPRAKSAYKQQKNNAFNVQEEPIRSVSAYENRQSLEELVPMPYMDHSKPKTVSVGSIGKISLLESISEAKYWEDVMKEQEKERIAQLEVNDLHRSDQIGHEGRHKTGPEGADIIYAESSHTVEIKKDETGTKLNGDRSESEILSIILKEAELNGDQTRADSAISDRLTPHEENFTGEVHPDITGCESPSAQSATSVDDDKNKVKQVLTKNAKQQRDKHKQKTNDFRKKTKRKSDEDSEVPSIKIEDTYMTENERYLRKLNEMLCANMVKEADSSSHGKKHVVLKTGRSTSSRSSRSGADIPSYKRLVNRVKDDISPKLVNRILSGP